MSDQIEQVSAIVLIVLTLLMIPRPDKPIAATSPISDAVGIVGADGVETFGQTCPLVPGDDRLGVVVKVETIVQPNLSSNQVEELFDRGWSEGVKTYTGLIEYVRATTGKGTSKSRVKAWKSERGYVDA